VFAAVPPLHRIELTNPRKGQRKYSYTYSDSELRRTLLELERKGQRWKEPVQRYKGLGEMDAGQLAETTMDPRHRILRRIRVEDTAAAAAIFELLMGSEVAPRRDFIVGGPGQRHPAPGLADHPAARGRGPVRAPGRPRLSAGAGPGRRNRPGGHRPVAGPPAPRRRSRRGRAPGRPRPARARPPL